MRYTKRFAVRFFGAAATLALALATTNALAQFASPVSFAPRADGTYSGSIPIRVAPASGGLTPQLSLTYSSNGGNGLLGVGFSLTGLSSITRCPQTAAQDGVRGSVTYTAMDRFCLDGQRLIATSGTYGADGTQYRTELETFSQIISHGTTGNGPSYFTVNTKSGLTETFGNSTTSAVLAQGKPTVRVWAVNRVQDQAGNYYTVTYTDDAANGAYYPNQISYTGNGTNAPQNTVTFGYQPRNEYATTWIAGSLVLVANQLNTIQVTAAGQFVRQYSLTYDSNGLGARSRLVEVQECASASGGPCLPPITLTWPAGNQTGKFTQGSTFTTNTCNAANNVVLGDFNGDGKQDFLCNTGSTQQVYLSTGSGGFSTPGAQSFCTNSTAKLLVADFDGDGKTDIACLTPEYSGSVSNGYAVAVGISKGDGTFGARAAWPASSGGFFCSSPGAAVAADIDGDGRADLVCISPGTVQVNFSNGDGTFTPKATWGGGTFCSTGSIQLQDIDGDGKADLVCATAGTYQVALSNGDGTFAIQPSWTVSGGWCVGTGVILQWGDFNGDGKQDMICHYGSGNSLHQVAFSMGNGQFSAGPQWPSTGTWCGGGTTNVADFNGDGKQDLVCSDTGGTFWLAYSNGDGTFNGYSVWPASGSSCVGTNAVYADFSGDGLADIGCFPTNTTAFVAAAVGAPDMISSVANGNGLAFGATYLPLTSSQVYTKDSGSNAATFPIVDVEAPYYAVASAWRSNGIGGNISTTYSYQGLKTDSTGRGSLGFRVYNATDPITSIVTTSTFYQAFPYTGLPLTAQTTLSGSGNQGVLTSVSTTYGCNDFVDTPPTCTVSAGRRYFTYATSASSANWDLNGAARPTKSTSGISYDSFGNQLTQTTTTSDGYSSQTSNTYNNDTTHWWIGQLIQSQVTNTTP